MTARKHWFKVPDSIAYEPWTNDQVAALIRLQAIMNTRWVRNGREPAERGKVELSRAEICLISGKHRRDIALKSLRSLAEVTSMSVRIQGEVVEIIWPKYAEFQQNETAKRPESGPSDSDSDSGTVTVSKKERKSAPSALVPVEPEVIGPGWAAVVDAMAAYVPSRSTCRSSPKRLSAMSKVAKAFGPTAPVDAIHGYAAMHFGKPASNGFDPEVTFTVETIWRPSNVAKYLDADRAAQAEGRFRPYTVEPRDSVRDTTQRVFELIKAERAAKGLH